MNRPTLEQIDAIVRAVLAELTRRADSERLTADFFAERLLTERHVEALNEGIGELRIAPGTIVTPLREIF